MVWQATESSNERGKKIVEKIEDKMFFSLFISLRKFTFYRKQNRKTRSISSDKKSFILRFDLSSQNFPCISLDIFHLRSFFSLIFISFILVQKLLNQLYVRSVSFKLRWLIDRLKKACILIKSRKLSNKDCADNFEIMNIFKG